MEAGRLESCGGQQGAALSSHPQFVLHTGPGGAVGTKENFSTWPLAFHPCSPERPENQNYEPACCLNLRSLCLSLPLSTSGCTLGLTLHVQSICGFRITKKRISDAPVYLRRVHPGFST